MSRIMGMIITLMYIAGGMLLGYYGHMLRLAAEANGATTETATAFYWAEPLALVGLIPVLLAILFHSRGISKARNLDRGHCATEQTLTVERDEAYRLLDEKNKKMVWIEEVITKAVCEEKKAATQALVEAKPKDYAE